MENLKSKIIVTSLVVILSSITFSDLRAGEPGVKKRKTGYEESSSSSSSSLDDSTGLIPISNKGMIQSSDETDRGIIRLRDAITKKRFAEITFFIRHYYKYLRGGVILAEVRSLLSGWLDELDVRDPRRNQLLFLAATLGDLAVVQRFFLSPNDNANLLDNEGFTVLHYAAMGHNRAVFDYLMEHGADLLNNQNNYQMTVLHMATWYGGLHVLRGAVDKVLIEYEGNPRTIYRIINAQDVYGNTVLDLAAKMRTGEVLKYLLEFLRTKLAGDTINLEKVLRMTVNAQNVCICFNNTEVMDQLFDFLSRIGLEENKIMENRRIVLGQALRLNKIEFVRHFFLQGRLGELDISRDVWMREFLFVLFRNGFIEMDWELVRCVIISGGLTSEDIIYNLRYLAASLLCMVEEGIGRSIEIMSGLFNDLGDPVVRALLSEADLYAQGSRIHSQRMMSVPRNQQLPYILPTTAMRFLVQRGWRFFSGENQMEKFLFSALCDMCNNENDGTERHRLLQNMNPVEENEGEITAGELVLTESRALNAQRAQAISEVTGLHINLANLIVMYLLTLDFGIYRGCE